MVALLSAIYFLKRTDGPSPEAFLEKARSIGARDPRFGWIHEKLLTLVREEGILAHRKEYRTKDGFTQNISVDTAITDFVKSLDQEVPVLVSIYKNWLPGQSFHLVLLVGYMGQKGAIEGFYVHDPDNVTEELGAFQQIPLETFKKGFRGLAIFVGS